MSQAPASVVLQYPLDERVTCPRCWGSADATLRTRGTFCDPAHLAKHQKKYHPGDTITFECSECRYEGKTRYPLKDVKKHFDTLHSSRPEAPDTRPPRTETTPTASTAASSSRAGARAGTSSSTSAPRAGTASARTRTTPVNRSPASDEGMRVTRSAARGAVTPSTRITNTRSTVTATRNTAPRPPAVPRSTTRRTPAQARTPPRTPDTPSTPAVVTLDTSSSGEDGRSPATSSYAAVTGAPATRTTTPSPSTRGAQEAAILESAEAFARTCGAAVSMIESAATAVLYVAAQSASRVSASQSAARVAASQSPSRVASIINNSRSPPETQQDRVSPLSSRVQQGSGAEGSVRNGHSTSLSSMHTPPRMEERAVTSGDAHSSSETRASTSSGRASAGSNASPREIPQTTPTTNHGADLGNGTATSVHTPVSSPGAAITTCTVVTTMAGGPVMSTGFPSVSGGQVTPPARAPSAFGSPKVARFMLKRKRGTTTSPSPNTNRVLRPRKASSALPRPPSASTPPSRSEGELDGNEGGSDDSWTVALGRGARRRVRRLARSSSSEEESGGDARASPGPPPITPTNYPPLPLGGSTPTTSRGATRGSSSGGTTPDARVEAATGQHAGVVSAVHASAPVNVRGVMGRRGTHASVGARAGAAGATAARANVASGAARPPVTRRSPARVAGRPGDVPAAATGAERRTARQRAVERERLVALAESAATLTDLEGLATQVVELVGEGGQGGRVVHPRDRAARSREVGNGDGRGRAGGGRNGVNARGPAPAGPRGGEILGEGGRDRGREAARIQALFRKNRRKAIREVLAGPAEVCDLPTERIQRHFEELYSGAGNLNDAAAPAELPEVSGDGDEAAALVAPFTEREVDRRLRRMNNSAPGPDGIAYRDLRAADPRGRLLAAVFNACLRLEMVPSSWKTSNTVLVYKKGERDRLENWRPLALGDTMPKLFAALLADRLTDWAIVNRKLSPAQKGFLRDEGCYEHNFVLQEILTDARRSRREVVVAWLDLSNAFGSVPHAAIRRALVSAGVPAGLIAIWGSMYDGCTTRVRTADGYTAPIMIRSGVRQGCPLSPVVFDLVIDSVLRAVADLGSGLELLGSRWSVMAYADDLVLVSRTPTDMKRLLAVAEREAASVGLRFNPAKCATLHVGGRAGGRVLPTPFVIQGQTVRTMADGEAYEHLGIPTGSSVNQTPHNILEALTEDLRAVDRSLLAPWQKSEAVATFLLPRMDFLLRGAHVEKRFLKAVDLNVRRTAKSWMNLPQRASAELVYIPPSRGGCGLLPMADLVDVLTIAHVFRLLTADDRAIRDLAWASLRGVVRRRIGRPPTCDDVASFLSGSLEGNLRGGGEQSLWSRARNAARRQSDRCVIRWRWLEEHEELVLECRGSRGRTVKIPPGARAQVIGRLRSSVAEFYTSTLLVKPDQGKVFEVSSRARVSNHFVRSGGFTRFADWRFVHRARLDVLPLNGARRWGDGDRRCRRCGENSETLPHVLCHCGPHSAAIQWRHDSVLLRLKRACRLPGDVTVNQRVRGLEGELGELRPDLVIRHEPSKSVVICDVTVPFENRWVAFEEARARKIAKYTPLAEELRRLGYRVVVTAFVVGALGSWDPANEAVLTQLGIGRTYASMMRRLMVSDTIRWSRDIYVEHVSGVRQYEAPSRSEEGVCPDVPIPRAIRRRVTGARADGGGANDGQSNSVNVA